MKTEPKKLDKFELGKYYKHSSGTKMYLCGVADSILYGTGFVAEDSQGNYSIVAMNSKEHTIGWSEITKKEYFYENTN